MTVLQYLFAFLLALGPLVLVHEFGHFIVAKLFGIGVPVFSFGFGPRLFGLRRGGTDYRVSAIPLGGYVRLAGDESDESRTGAPGEFLSRPRWQRFFVFVAGATFNIVLAFLALWLMFAVWGKREVPNPDSRPVVMAVAEGSAAQGAGLERGDTIVEIAGRDVMGAEEFRSIYNREIVLSPGTRKSIVVERSGRRVELGLDIGSDKTFGHGADPGWYLSWSANETPAFAEVIPGQPADEAGLEVGDRVLAADGRRPISELDLRLLLESSPGRELALVIERGGREIALSVVPRDEGGKGKVGAVIGLPPVQVDLSLFAAAEESLRENLANSIMLFEVLKRLVTREVPIRSVSGPIGIAQFAWEALASPRTFVWLLGFLSLQLGILNLLPIPVLDGGHILILAVEGTLRRELSERIKERVMQVGFVFLLAFMSVVIVLDLFKFGAG